MKKTFILITSLVLLLSTGVTARAHMGDEQMMGDETVTTEATTEAEVDNEHQYQSRDDMMRSGMMGGMRGRTMMGGMMGGSADQMMSLALGWASPVWAFVFHGLWLISWLAVITFLVSGTIYFLKKMN